MSSDPLGLYEKKQPSGSGAGFLSTLLLLAALAFLGWQVYERYGSGFGRDGQEEVEPSPSVAGKTLVFVHERNPQSIEHDLLLREMPAWTAERGLSFRAFDKDVPDEPIPQLVAWAKSKGVEPPFVLLTGKDDKPVKVVAWPSGIDGLKELVK